MLLDLNMLAVFKIKYECEFDLKLSSYGSKSVRRFPQQILYWRIYVFYGFLFELY